MNHFTYENFPVHTLISRTKDYGLDEDYVRSILKKYSFDLSWFYDVKVTQQQTKHYERYPLLSTDKGVLYVYTASGYWRDSSDAKRYTDPTYENKILHPNGRNETGFPEYAVPSQYSWVKGWSLLCELILRDKLRWINKYDVKYYEPSNSWHVFINVNWATFYADMKWLLAYEWDSLFERHEKYCKNYGQKYYENNRLAIKDSKELQQLKEYINNWTEEDIDIGYEIPKTRYFISFESVTVEAESLEEAKKLAQDIKPNVSHVILKSYNS